MDSNVEKEISLRLKELGESLSRVEKQQADLMKLLEPKASNIDTLFVAREHFMLGT